MSRFLMLCVGIGMLLLPAGLQAGIPSPSSTTVSAPQDSDGPGLGGGYEVPTPGPGGSAGYPHAFLAE